MVFLQNVKVILMLVKKQLFKSISNWLLKYLIENVFNKLFKNISQYVF